MIDYTEDEARQLRRIAWSGNYTSDKCKRCSRYRVMICQNGMHRCEKCNWCPELDTYIDVFEWTFPAARQR